MRPVEQNRSRAQWAGAILAPGLAGFLTMAAMLTAVGGMRGPETLYLLGAATLGAIGGTLPVARAFGRADVEGWAVAIVGAVFATSLGSFLGGLILGGALAVYETGASSAEVLNAAFFSAMIVWMMIVEEPMVSTAWAASMTLVHLWFRSLRSESSGCP